MVGGTRSFVDYFGTIFSIGQLGYVIDFPSTLIDITLWVMPSNSNHVVILLKFRERERDREKNKETWNFVSRTWNFVSRTVHHPPYKDLLLFQLHQGAWVLGNEKKTIIKD